MDAPRRQGRGGKTAQARFCWRCSFCSAKASSSRFCAQICQANHATCLTFVRGLQLLFLPTAPSQFQTPAAPPHPPPHSAAAPFPACARLLFAKQSLRQRQAHNTGDDLSVSGIACLKCTPADAMFGAWTVAITLSNPQRPNPSARAALAASLA